jgi:hypothetical protein
MSELKIFLFTGLDPKLQLCGPCKISLKNSKNSYLYCSTQIEVDIMQNHEQKKKMKMKKSEKPRFYGQNKLLS